VGKGGAWPGRQPNIERLPYYLATLLHCCCEQPTPRFGIAPSSFLSPAVPYSESMADWTMISNIKGCPCCMSTTQGITLCAEVGLLQLC